jgi:hypothetical protein
MLPTHLVIVRLKLDRLRCVGNGLLVFAVLLVCFRTLQQNLQQRQISEVGMCWDKNAVKFSATEYNKPLQLTKA